MAEQLPRHLPDLQENAYNSGEVGAAYMNFLIVMKFGIAELADNKQHTPVSVKAGRQQRATRQIVIGATKCSEQKFYRNMKYTFYAVADHVFLISRKCRPNRNSERGRAV